MMKRSSLIAVINAALVVAISASFSIGLIGLLVNWLTQPEHAFERVISTTSAVVALAVSLAFMGMVKRQVWLQIVGGGIVVLSALHSLATNLSAIRVFNLNWLSNVDAQFNSPIAAIFLILGASLMLNPRHNLQRLWLRTLSAALLIGSLIILGLHLTEHGFAYLGPHPPVTSMAGLFVFLISITMMLVTTPNSNLANFPCRKLLYAAFLFIFITCGSWYLLSLNQIRTVQNGAVNIVNNVAEALTESANRNIQLTNRVVARWESLGLEPQAELVQDDMTMLLGDMAYIQALYVIDSSGRAIRQQQQAEIQIPTNLLAQPHVQNWLNSQIRYTDMLIPGFETPATEAVPILVMTPVQYKFGEQWYLLAVIDLQQLIRVETKLLPPDLKIYAAVHGGARFPLEQAKPSKDKELFLSQTEFSVPSGPTIQLSAYLYRFDELLNASNLRVALVFLGFIFCCMFLVMTQQNRQVLQHSRRLTRTQQRMQAQQQQLDFSQQQYRSLYSNNPDAVFALDRSGVFISANQAVLDLLKLPKSQILGQHFSTLVVAEDLEFTVGEFQTVLAGESRRYEVRIYDADHNVLHLDITNLPIKVGGKITGCYGIAKDITQRKADEAHRLILDRSINVSTNGVIICDAQQHDLPIIYVNERFQQITGYSEREILGINCRFLQGPETSPESLEKIRSALADNSELRTEILNYRKDGTPFWNELQLAPVFNESGVVTHYIGVQNDVSESVKNQQQLSYQASHDLLTELPNRTSLEAELIRQVGIWRQTDGASQLAVLVIDLDGFKPINDAMGLAIGDRLLIEVAHRLRRKIRGMQTAARFGSDEFVAIIPDLSDTAELTELVNEVLNYLAEPYQIDEHKIYLTASIGITLCNELINNPVELVQQAGMATTQAKRHGRNHHQFYAASNRAGFEARVTLRSQFQQAIDNDELQLHYQPVIDLQSDEICAVEALMRWQLADGTFISPAQFIPLAEATGQIIPASSWALRQACKDLKSLQQYSTISVAVNLSAMQFSRANFVEHITDIIGQAQVNFDQVELELTESILMDDTAHAIEILQRLRSNGIKIAIDDFGTGFSSLSYLTNLPTDKLKIDRSFIKDIVSSSKARSTVKCIIEMAHQHDLVVVAEGIETKEQADVIRDLGCDMAQGYYFARPMPHADLAALLRRQEEVTGEFS
ncbi:putative bifunctional diguanylate cyclase/phosphodiesterase [Pseudidiomarina salinarum]|uniref:putative bifunctional diguanylate cyclase/phosphodiesterase n=1 Tax=Pseudidiomarina salinarum TaxID=435908 RepID=UPI0006899689|nr:EAL domain-containing protein [Pseudidiomarina salinarum]RUO70207.1 GGDEF domain-containing protein [Pseudidiomarina salinarum]